MENLKWKVVQANQAISLFEKMIAKAEGVWFDAEQSELSDLIFYVEEDEKVKAVQISAKNIDDAADGFGKLVISVADVNERG